MNITVKMKKTSNANYFGVSTGSSVSLDIEEYLRGVVPNEVRAGYDHMEALKAQTIAARTFALFLHNYDSVNLTDSSSTAQNYAAGAYHDRTDEAIDATRGQVLGYSGKYVFAQFSASNGGTTVAYSKYPYLIAQADPWTTASGIARNGHGQGMSQAGMNYAATQGISCYDILMFYYDNVRMCENYDVSGTVSGSLKDSYSRSEYFNDEDYRTANLDFGTTTLKYVSGSLMSGTAVRNVQTRLNYLGYNPGTIDGYFGKNTEAAVLRFQKYAGPFLGGLDYDGIVGANTRKALKHPAID